MRFPFTIIFVLLVSLMNGQMIGIGLSDQVYLNLPENTSYNHYSQFPYGPQDMDIHFKIPVKPGITVSPYFGFSIMPGAYSSSFEDGFYADPETWISMPELTANRPEYIAGYNYKYAEGETYVSHKMIGFSVAYESLDAFEIGVGVQFVRRKIIDVHYDAYDEYRYSDTEDNLDWYYSHKTLIGASHENEYMQNDIQFPIYVGYLFNTDYTQMGSYVYFYLGRYNMVGFRVTYSFGVNKY